MAEPIKREMPEGWWTLGTCRGTREGVLKAIELSNVPLGWKTAIQLQIKSIDAKFNFFKVNAHCHVEKGILNYHINITPSEVLT